MKLNSKAEINELPFYDPREKGLYFMVTMVIPIKGGGLLDFSERKPIEEVMMFKDGKEAFFEMTKKQIEEKAIAYMKANNLTERKS